MSKGNPIITFRLEVECQQWLKRVAEKTGKDRSEVIRDALMLYRENEQKHRLT